MIDAPDSLLSREDRACLLLALGHLSPPQTYELDSLISRPLNWNALIDRSVEHEVYPMVFRNLRNRNFASMPAECRSRLQTIYQANALRNELLARELVHILELLNQAGISVIPLKGLPLAESLYGDLNARTCVDIDILVRWRDVPEAFKLLRANGYHSEFPEWVLPESMMRNSIECQLWRGEGESLRLLELHWSLQLESSKQSAGLAAVWAEARPKTFHGAAAFRASTEDELAILLVHAARHWWHKLKWLIDIHQICSMAPVKWELLERRAQSLGWERMIRFGLTICRSLLETPVPHELANQFPEPMPRLFPSPMPPITTWTFHAHLLRLTKGPGAKIRLMGRRILVPTPADCKFIALPGSLAFLYYGIRPVRWLYEAGRALLGVSSGQHGR